ncbi:MAG TPA: hypothetical protein PKB05_03060 [Oligoflexia bacterium]|nr:hypothetical protein [Oligoflexia bacterium]
MFLKIVFAQNPGAPVYNGQYNNESDYILEQQNNYASQHIEQESDKLLNFFQGHVSHINWVEVPNGTVSWEPYQKYLALVLLQKKFSDLKARYAPNDEPTDAWLEILNASNQINVYFGSPEQYPNFIAKKNKYINYYNTFFEQLKQQYRDLNINPYQFIRDH